MTSTAHEIVAELADLDPIARDVEEGDHCFFCDASWKAARSEFGGLTMRLDHDDDCLHVRAQNVDTKPLRELLADWFEAELSVISEYGSSLDWPKIIDDAKARHATFGVPWSNDFVPGYIRDILALDADD